MQSTTTSSPPNPPASEVPAGPAARGGVNPPASEEPAFEHEPALAFTRFLPVLERAARPPLRDTSFWVVQGMVFLLAGLHLVVDIKFSDGNALFPTGIPVESLLLPVGYAALRYGLAGSLATSLWATLLWLPDLALPVDEGHRGNDLVELAIVIAVAVFVGIRVERERRARLRAEEAESEHRAAETRYRELFDTNASPTIIVDAEGRLQDSNPAAVAVLGSWETGTHVSEMLGVSFGELSAREKVLTIRVYSPEKSEEREFRLLVSELNGANERDPAVVQVVLQDVTMERRERAYTASLIFAQEEERRRIAQEIHDDPLQTLIQLSRRIDGFSTRADGAPARGVLDRVRTDLLGVVTQLRNVARGLRPPGLDQLGLVAAVKGLLADIEDESELEVDLVVTGVERRLPPEVEVGLFRIVQEAGNNVIRHAGAGQMWVRVEYRADSMRVRVVDDGVGYSPAAMGAGGGDHMGVMGMYERATLLGGCLDISSALGKGTRVDATIPIPHQTGGLPLVGNHVGGLSFAGTHVGGMHLVGEERGRLPREGSSADGFVRMGPVTGLPAMPGERSFPPASPGH